VVVHFPQLLLQFFFASDNSLQQSILSTSCFTTEHVETQFSPKSVLQLLIHLRCKINKGLIKGEAQ
jgi:hypothetical protein